MNLPEGSIPQALTEYSPTVRASWHGAGLGLHYNGVHDQLYLNLGYTITITTKFRLRTSGSGLKLGYLFNLPVFAKPEDRRIAGNFYTMGYQHSRTYYGLFMQNHFQPTFGFGIGYDFL